MSEERQDGRTVGEARRLPRDDREDGRQHVVGRVPGVQDAAQDEQQDEQQQRVGAPAPGEERQGHGHEDDQRVADRREPVRSRPVALLDHAAAAADHLTRPPEEPPHLPRLEDHAGVCGGGRRRARTGQQQRQHERDRDPARDEERAPAIRLQREQHRADREQRPRLVGDRQPEEDPGQRRAASHGGEHRAGAHRGAEQLLGMADVERPQGDRVHRAHAHDDRGRPAARAAGEQARREHDAERSAREQARKADGTEHGDVPATEGGRGQRERRTHDQRSAVGGQCWRKLPTSPRTSTAKAGAASVS